MKNIIIANAPELQRALATKVYCELIAGGIIFILVVLIAIVYIKANWPKGE